MGLGEIIPRSYLSGETIESAWSDLRASLWPALQKIEFSDEDPAIQLAPIFKQASANGQIAAFSGLDIAVYDAWSRATKIPLVSLLGGKRETIRFTFPLGGSGPRKTRILARLGKFLGYRDFKLKTGLAKDEERLREARRVLGDRADLRVDANAGWTAAEVRKLKPLFHEVRISSLEQPLPANEISEMVKLERDLGIAVMADESLCTWADAEALSQAGGIRLWNLRLAKNGGFTGFRAILDVAKKSGTAVHHGVLVGESPILTAAARVAASLGPFTHSEYGFPTLLLKTRIAKGAPRGVFGQGTPFPEKKLGLGIEIRGQALDSVCVRRERWT